MQLAPVKDAAFVSHVLNVRSRVHLICVLSGGLWVLLSRSWFASSLASRSLRTGSGLYLPAEFGFGPQ